MSEQGGNLVYESGPWQVHLGRRELLADGIPVPIGARAFEIIEVLVRSANDLVTKNDLMGRIWPGATVEENTLQVHISAIRKAFGPDRAMLKTLSGRGYRLLGNWTARSWTNPAPPAPEAEAISEPFRSNVPASMSDLVGRSGAIRQLQDLLSAYRMVTLTGPGGIGKTVLALEAARDLLSTFNGDGWFVELGSLSDPALVPSTVASVLGMKLGGDVSATSLARRIGARKLFLVLDNCEHVVDAVADLAATVMRMCPRTTVLATSREVLRIAGEHVYRVAPLEVPAERQKERANILEHSAIQLFIARAQALHADFLLEGDSLSAIATVCRRLDGIPLAIEFAAARAAALGIAQVAAHLDDRFGLLNARRRTALPHHQTLRATLDWSYELLPEPERRLLRHLAIFVGGFTLEAATAVMHGGAESHFVVAADVSNLVEKSLVTLESSEPVGRWRLLETIRLYALEKLADHGEVEEAARRHAQYFVDRITPSTLGLPLQPVAEDMASHARELGNVRAALEWSGSGTGDKAIGIRLTAAYVPVWAYLGLMTESGDRADEAADKLESGVTLDSSLKIHIYLALGLTFLFTLRSAQRARTALLNALAGAKEANDLKVQVLARWGLWILHCNVGESREAHATALEFERTANDTGDPGILLMANRLIGTALHLRGQQSEARKYFEHQLQHYVAPKEQRYTAWLQYDQRVLVQAMLARVLAMQGLVDQAAALTRASLEAAQAMNSKSSILEVTRWAGFPVMLMVGDLDRAESAAAMLLDLAVSMDAPYWVNAARCFNATLRIERGDFEEGIVSMRAALDVAGQTGWSVWHPEFLGSLAKGIAGLGRVAEAIVILDEALAEADRDGEAYFVPELLRTKGEMLLRDANAAAAERCFGEALDAAQQQGAPFWELRIAMSLARLRSQQHRPGEAREVLSTAYARFTEGFATADLQAARAMLDGLTA